MPSANVRLQQQMINHLITIPGDNMTIKTKASHGLRLFNAKSCILSGGSGGLLGMMGGASVLPMLNHKPAGLTWSLICSTFHQEKEYQGRSGCFSSLTASSRARPPLCLFPFPRWRAGRVTDTEGSQRRPWQPGIKPQQDSATDWRAGGGTQRAVQAFIGPFPSHLSH